MKNNTTQQKSSEKLTSALRDGLIAITGLGIAAGSVLNTDITMWWMGA